MAGNRFYLPYYREAPDRPVYFEDLGNLLKISGIVVQGMGSTMVLLSRQMQPEPGENVTWVTPSLEEWGKIIAQTDDPQIFIGEEGGVNKILHRKLRYTISGEVQQRIWARDDFRCQYCFVKMGQALMTIDHFTPLEMGGLNDERNYLTACRRCNKAKGMRMPEPFCKDKGFDYQSLVHYLDTLYPGEKVE